MKFQAQGLPVMKVYPHVMECVIGPQSKKLVPFFFIYV